MLAYNPVDVEAVVVIPYRNRAADLEEFKKTVPAAFREQNVKAVFVIAEQADDLKFNRGLLINVGWKEGIRRFPRARGFYFHDVDVWPLTGKSLYYAVPKPGWMHHIYGVKCTERLNSWGGGLGAISKVSLYKTNGFPNDFWGWGAEDNAFGNRIKAAGVNVDVKRLIIRGDHTKIYENMDTDRDLTRHSKNAMKLFSGEYDRVENGISNVQYGLLGERVDDAGFLWLRLDLSAAPGADDVRREMAAATATTAATSTCDSATIVASLIEDSNATTTGE